MVRTRAGLGLRLPLLHPARDSLGPLLEAETNPPEEEDVTDTRGIERNLYEIARQLAALRAVLERIERRLR
ncbi:MAG: hypothetical protein OXG81_03095 [Acidobacteria bacterium]|nr:hypothetical protein [Acidobacteriota bacterium]